MQMLRATHCTHAQHSSISRSRQLLLLFLCETACCACCSCAHRVLLEEGAPAAVSTPRFLALMPVAVGGSAGDAGQGKGREGGGKEEGRRREGGGIPFLFLFLLCMDGKEEGGERRW